MHIQIYKDISSILLNYKSVGILFPGVRLFNLTDVRGLGVAQIRQEAGATKFQRTNPDVQVSLMTQSSVYHLYIVFSTQFRTVFNIQSLEMKDRNTNARN